jgi:hypothetical protein
MLLLGDAETWHKQQIVKLPSETSSELEAANPANP